MGKRAADEGKPRRLFVVRGEGGDWGAYVLMFILSYL
jgi:hypothetical protein